MKITLNPFLTLLVSEIISNFYDVANVPSLITLVSLDDELTRVNVAVRDLLTPKI